MKTSQLQRLLESVYPVRQEVIPCLLGDPGIGKTQAIHQFAEKHGVKVVTFILSHALPSEVSGIRMPDLEHDELRVLDDAKMMSLQDGDILFFDELLEAPQQLWSAVLTLLQDRTMASGRKLPDVMIVAASNKSATAKQIPPSTRDRFVWVDLEFDFNSWSKWFRDKYEVTPVSQLQYMFFKDSGYNIITPRKFTKLYEWLELNQWQGIAVQIIQEMFGKVMYDKLYSTHMNVSEKQQLVDALKELKLCALPEDFEMLSIEELASILMKRDDWGEIAAALQQIERKEESCMF